MAEGLAARRAALALLAGVMVKGLSLAEQGDAPLAGLAPGDRARAQRLALAVMRRAEPIDRLLGTFLHKEPPLAALNILRLAVVELAEGSAAHGVVNSAVELARRDKETNGLAGMINAVLRKVVPPVEIAGPAQRLPGWLRQALVARYGKVAVGVMEAVSLPIVSTESKTAERTTRPSRESSRGRKECAIRDCRRIDRVRDENGFRIGRVPREVLGVG